MDEYIGTRRVRMTVIVLEAVRPKKLVWQLKKLVNLPVRLYLELADYEGGVAITHTVRAGFMDDHAKTEFPMLRDRRDKIQAELSGR